MNENNSLHRDALMLGTFTNFAKDSSIISKLGSFIDLVAV